MTKVVLSIFVGAVLVTGCLFPSFDDMQSGQKGAIAAKGDDITATNGTAPSTTTTAADGSASDAAPASAAKTGGVISCGTDPDGGAPVECSIASGDGCCTTIGGPDCQNNGALAFCRGPQSGSILHCDDKDDCNGSDVCCFDAGAKVAACSPICAGTVMCRKDNPKCPAGKSCTGVLNLQGGFTSSSCQ